MKSSARIWTLLGLIISGLGFLGIIGLLYFRPPELPIQTLVWALIGLGFSLVMMDILGFELFRHKPVSPPPASFSVWRILVLVYVLIPIVLVFPIWLVALGLGVDSFFTPVFDIKQLFSLPAPWLWLIQGGILFLLLLPVFPLLREKENPLEKPFTSARGAVLLGWMTALMTLYGVHLKIRLLGFESPSPSIPAGIQAWVAGILAVIILPISEELFFRKYLYQSLQVRFSPSQALWLTAGIFALVQGRPLLFLPALLFSALLQWLTNATGDLRGAMLAHAFANLLAMVINWTLIL